MVQVALDEMQRLDRAFAGNQLLSTFSRETRSLIEPYASIVDMKVGERVLRRGEAAAASIFPFGATMISMVAELAGGRTIEVASIGREGAVGGIISCGHAPAFSEAVVQVPGPVMRVPMAALEEAKRRSGFIANIFCRYSDCLLSQVMQSVVCNTFHTISERAARWLLTAQDRAGDRIELTQEALAGLLGVQRTTLNAVVRQLQDGGLINVHRGAIQVLDRVALKRHACECYEAIEEHFKAVIGPSGSGALSGDACA